MPSLSTGSWFVYGNDTVRGVRTCTASTDIEVEFRDFGRLGEVATEMAEMTGVEVRRVKWALTEETKARYAKVARKGAIRNALDKAVDYATEAGRNWVSAVEIVEESVGNLFGAAAPGSFGSGGMLTRRGGVSQEQRLGFEPENYDVACQIRVICESNN
jgi:hypothetical protein